LGLEADHNFVANNLELPRGLHNHDLGKLKLELELELERELEPLDQSEPAVADTDLNID
jgi:hypothetical protein